jgi:hypothetical protein
MAVTVTGAVEVVGNRRVIRIRAVETGISSSSEWSTSGLDINLPGAGYVQQLQAVRTAGTGTTIQPRIGKATGWADSTIDAVCGVATPAAYHNEGIPAPFCFGPSQARVLYFRSTPDNAAADHSVETLVVITEQL